MDGTRTAAATLLLVLASFMATAPDPAAAQAARTVDWPVRGGTTDHIHYTTLDQISPANVGRLEVAWTYDTGDAFPGSEMQATPIVVDGVLYATSPKMRVFALDAASGREIWSFDPTGGRPPTSRIRHRGVVVTGDRVLFNYRSTLWALDRRTGRPIPSFGEDGAVDLRAGLGRPVEAVTLSGSSPGAVFENLLTVFENLREGLVAPGAPGPGEGRGDLFRGGVLGPLAGRAPGEGRPLAAQPGGRAGAMGDHRERGRRGQRPRDRCRSWGHGADGSAPAR